MDDRRFWLADLGGDTTPKNGRLRCCAARPVCHVLAGTACLLSRGLSQWGTHGLGGCPTPALTGPEAPSRKVLWQTCQVPCQGLGATRPPQTLGHPGAVKPDPCPGTCTHAYTAMFLTGGHSWS